MAPWSPERSTSGTDQDRNSAGRVYCGSSSRPPRPNDSDTADVSFPITPASRRVDGLDHHHRRGLAAGQHVVAHRQLAVDQVLAHPVVDALVAPAEQGEPLRAGQLARQGLVEPAARRAEEVERSHGLGGLDAGEDRLGPQDHPGAASEGGVVDGAVDVGGVVPQVVAAQVQPAGLTGPAEEALLAEDIHDAREDRKTRRCERPWRRGAYRRSRRPTAPPCSLVVTLRVSNGTLRASYLAMNLAWPSVTLTRQLPPQERP